MADFPHFPFYAEDFATGTGAMSPLEVGIYIRCLCHQWSHGSIPSDRARVARLAGATLEEVEAAWPHIAPKFEAADPGELKNARLEIERERVLEISERRSAAGRAGAYAKHGKRSPVAVASAMANAVATAQQTDSKHGDKTLARAFDFDSDSDFGSESDSGGGCKGEDPPIDPPAPATEATVRFEVWWSSAPRRVGRGKAFSAYSKAVRDLRKRGEPDPHGFLLERIRAFASSPKGQGSFCPYPATWLNEGRYDDDPAAWIDPGSGTRSNAAKPSHVHPAEVPDPHGI